MRQANRERQQQQQQQQQHRALLVTLQTDVLLPPGKILKLVRPEYLVHGDTKMNYTCPPSIITFSFPLFTL